MKHGHDHIEAISLMLAVGCNLQCDYCLINQSIQNIDFIKDMKEKTIQSLEDGSYLQNTLNVIQKLSGDPNDIRTIDLWGQEPTLSLEHFTAHIKEWLTCFPNVEKFFFSTNGVAYWNKIYDLFIAMDECLDHQIDIILQWSYDGDFSTNNIRHGSSNIIENLKLLIQKLNNKKFKYININISIHGVLSFALMREISDDIEKIENYFNNCQKMINSIQELNWNDRLSINDTISFAEETPYKCSTEEGIEWFNFINKLLIVESKINNRFSTYINDVYLNAIKRIFPPHIVRQFNSFDDIIIALCENLNPNNENLSWEEYSQAIFTSEVLSDSFYCGTGIGEIKILYDGTLINCQNSIYEQFIENINPEINITNEVKRSQSRKGIVFINPLTDSMDKVERYLYLFKTGRESTFWHTFLTTCQKMKIMSLARQISPLYSEDDLLLLKHAFILCTINQCSYNNGIYTGSYWCRDTGLIRRYCNGLLFLEEACQKINKYILESKTNCDNHHCDREREQ